MSVSVSQQSPRTGAPRSPAEIAALLVELGRAMRGLQFYPEGHPTQQELLERTLGILRAELERRGPIELLIRKGAFWLGDGNQPVGGARLEDLARDFMVRGVRRVLFEPTLEGPSLRGLLEILVADREALARAGGAEAVFHAEPRRGIQLNEANYTGALEPSAAPEPEELELAEEGELEGELSDLELEPAEPPLEPLAPLEPLLEPPDEAGGPSEELAAVLEELDACDHDPIYPGLAARAVELATMLASEGVTEASHSALELLAQHGGDDAKRSPAQREAAREALHRLVALPAVRADLIDRACAPQADASLRATQILLRLGGDAVLPLLDQLESEPNADRRGQLAGILIAMGEAAGPELQRAMDAGGPRRVRVAVRLAGESQNPRTVPALRRLLVGPDESLRREAAKALLRVGDEAAFSALFEALASPLAGVPELAAFCLGASGRLEALSPLAAALDEAVRTGRRALAHETIRALGRLGLPQATSALEAVLHRRSLLRRRSLQELKVAATNALGRLPGPEARAALRRAREDGDARVRDAAAQALERASEEASRG